MIYSRIIGTGGYLPERIVTNHDLEKIVETSHEWIVERTGVHQRHIAAEQETSLDLAFRASQRAITAARIEPQDIDLIIVATTTPAQIFPSTACLLQNQLGIDNCAAFDVQAVCTGFIYAIDIADKYIKTGAAKCVLVVGSETLSRIIDWKDRTTCVLFGDGAGAVILQSSSEPGILHSQISAAGQYHSLLNVPGGISMGCKRMIEEGVYIKMQGSEVFKMAVQTLGKIVDESLECVNMTRDQIDWLVPHQANTRIIAATAKKLNMTMEKVVITVATHANTSAASVPLALDAAVRDGRIKPGEVILLEAFGGGFTWGATLLRY